MGKNLVVCCDGTDNNITTDSTNVFRLYRMLVRDQNQVAFFDSGVGTTIDPTAIGWYRKFLSTRLDAAVGLRVRENAVSAYRFLVRNYEPGDRIYMFGFSRGAYTVRAVAGMVKFLGLLRPELEHLATFGWALYSDEARNFPVSKRFQGSNDFKRNFSRQPDVRVHFLGVWDTVSSFGFFWNFQSLPYAAKNDQIDHIRHAMAIDERRAMFRSYIYFPPDDPASPQDRKQVWFAGAHADVGGGYPNHEAGLAIIPLLWMLREAEAKGLMVDPLKKAELTSHPPPDPLGKSHESLVGWWRLLEFVPRRLWNVTKEKMEWRWPNFFGRRTIRPNPVIHESVQTRMAHGPSNYKPSNLPTPYTVEH